MKRLAAVLVSVLGFAFTANGYRALTKRPYGSVFASELPMQSLGVQVTALAAVAGAAGLAPRRAKGR